MESTTIEGYVNTNREIGKSVVAVLSLLLGNSMALQEHSLWDARVRLWGLVHMDGLVLEVEVDRTPGTKHHPNVSQAIYKSKGVEWHVRAACRPAPQNRVRETYFRTR